MFTKNNAKFHVNNAIQEIEGTIGSYNPIVLLQKMQHGSQEIMNKHRRLAEHAGCHGALFDSEYVRRLSLLSKAIEVRRIASTQSQEYMNPLFRSVLQGFTARSGIRDELQEALQQLQAPNATDAQAVHILEQIVPAKVGTDFSIGAMRASEYLVHRGWYEALKRLLNLGANPSIALYAAIHKKNLPLLNLLLESGANPDYTSLGQHESAVVAAQRQYHASPDDPLVGEILLAVMEAPPLEFNAAVPPSYLCPILGEIMTDPCFTADGHTYERSAIMTWLEDHNTSPLTNAPLANKTITPNIILKGLISDWIKEHALAVTPASLLTQGNVQLPSMPVSEPGESVTESLRRTTVTSSYLPGLFHSSLHEQRGAEVTSPYPRGLISTVMSLRVYESLRGSIKHESLALATHEFNSWINLTTLKIPGIGRLLSDYMSDECKRILYEVSPSRVIYNDEYLKHLCSSVRYGTACVGLPEATYGNNTAAEFVPVLDLESRYFQTRSDENYVLALSFTEDSPAVKVDRILIHASSGGVPCMGRNNNTNFDPSFTASSVVHVIFISFKPIATRSSYTPGRAESGYADDQGSGGVLLEENEAFLLEPDSIQMISIVPIVVAANQPELRHLMRRRSEELLEAMKTKAQISSGDQLKGRGLRPEGMIQQRQRLQGKATQALAARVQRQVDGASTFGL